MHLIILLMQRKEKLSDNPILKIKIEQKDLLDNIKNISINLIFFFFGIIFKLYFNNFKK